MLPYRRNLKLPARQLRNHQTDAEQCLWFRIRRKQLAGVQFYRQKPIGPYIVDFYAPSIRLVIEVDGSQHAESQQICQDKVRDDYLKSIGLMVLRFDNLQVLKETDTVVAETYRWLKTRKNPP